MNYVIIDYCRFMTGYTMENDGLFWLIAFAFFLPMHLGAPALFLFIQGSSVLQNDSTVTKVRLHRLLLRGLLVAAAGFALAFWLWPNTRLGAGLTLAVTLLIPWLDMLIASKYRER